MAQSDDDLRQKTIQTFIESAESLAAYYENIGPREGDIELAFALAGNPENGRVLEIGCGPGREAREILRRTPHYTGIDISEGFLQHAQKQAPKGTYRLASLVDYDYSIGTYDIVFALSSLAYLDQEEVTTVLRKVYKALAPGGVFYISLKYGPKYEQKVREDRFGTRLYYLYNTELIQKLAGPGYKNVYDGRNYIEPNDTEWFEIALQKQR